MLEEPALLTIRKNFERIPADKIAALHGAQTGHLIDAMFGRGGLDGAIKALDPHRSRFIGTAFPVETGPSDNLAISAAIAFANEGDVIVAASDAFERTAVCGDIVAMLAKNAGCAGIVIDGMARDIAGLDGVGLPVFCRGITPNSCVKSGPGKVGLPVVAGGVRVEAGDLVMGDRDGVVVVPRVDLDRVIAAVAEIRKAEAALIARIQSDNMTTFPFMTELLASDKVKFVD
ncbi:MAG: RraA family protein [Alphaproteobacteria bacterium]|nr:RraA family protein [Alphaproteobacteria bacterium]